MDHTLSAKTAKFMSLENLYEYGIHCCNTPDKNIDILLIAIYCDILQYIATFIAFKVVSIRLLHHKYD